MSLNSEIMKIFDKKDKGWKESVINKVGFLVHHNCYMYSKYTNHEDLIQDGFVGLLRAINTYDPSRFSNFMSYADRWIVHYVKRSASRFDIVYSPSRARVVYGVKNENDFCPDDIPENILLDTERKRVVELAINKLKGREFSIIRQSFGIKEKKKTLREIGDYFNISYERVRQIRARALLKLKKSLSDYEDKK